MIAGVKCGCGEELDSRDIVPNRFEVRCWKCGDVHSLDERNRATSERNEHEYSQSLDGLFKIAYSSEAYEHWRKSRIP